MSVADIGTANPAANSRRASATDATPFRHPPTNQLGQFELPVVVQLLHGFQRFREQYRHRATSNPGFPPVVYRRRQNTSAGSARSSPTRATRPDAQHISTVAANSMTARSSVSRSGSPVVAVSSS